MKLHMLLINLYWKGKIIVYDCEPDTLHMGH